MAPCYVTIAGVAPLEGAILTCDSGTGRHVQELTPEMGALAVSNMDPHSGELPSAEGARAEWDTARSEPEPEPGP